MTFQSLDPELRPALKRIPQTEGEPGALARMLAPVLAPLFIRAYLPKVDFPSVTTTVLRRDGFRARVHRPTPMTVAPGLLWMHGGGLITGFAAQDDAICKATAAALRITTVSIEYRLAPRHPYPAAHEDTLAAWDWIQRNGPLLGIDPGEVAIGGESAGGGLAAALGLRLLDRGGPQPRAQWLFTPMLDDRTVNDRTLDTAGHVLHTNAANRRNWNAYLRGNAGTADIPAYAAPGRRANLSGLPPHLVVRLCR